MSTQDLVDLTHPDQPLFGLNTTNEGWIVIFAGGIPLQRVAVKLDLYTTSNQRLGKFLD
jgi:hypothetical protein